MRQIHPIKAYMIKVFKQMMIDKEAEANGLNQKHFTRDQLLYQMNKTAYDAKNAKSSAFSGLSILCNYAIWKNENFRTTKLQEYNGLVAEYESRYMKGEITVEEMSDRLNRKAGFTLTYIPYTEIANTKNKALRWLSEKDNVSNNNVSETCIRYQLEHYNALMDMGFGKVRLERVKGYIQDMLNGLAELDIWSIRKELIDEAGVYIEMPAN